MSQRRLEREYAFKILFAQHFNKQAVGEVVESLKQTDEQASAAISPFALELVEKTNQSIESSDELIESKLKNWKLERITLTDKLLMRMAITEFNHFEDIPIQVTMNEVIELAKSYGTDKSAAFINGVLDSIYQDINVVK